MLDILRPAASKAKTAPAPAPRAVSPASPASSTSTLKASSAYHARSDHARSSSKAAAGSARSKGQQARRLSIESAVSSSHRHRSNIQKDRSDQLFQHNIASSSSSRSSPRLAPSRRSAFASDPHATHVAKGRSKHGHSSSANITTSSVDPYRDESSRKRKRSNAQSPLLGGLYFSDLIVVAFFYAVNLLRTCGIAELVDVAFKAFAYVCTRLPFDFYQRWSLSRPSSSHYGWYQPLTASAETANHQSHQHQSRSLATRMEPASAYTSATAVSAVASSSDEETTSHEAFEEDAQLSPFHHLTLLLVRFACTSFPHLVPRVLFAEETIGPLVRWRTGGGAAGIVREFTSDSRSPESSSATAALPRAAIKNDPLRKAAGTANTAASSDRAKSKPKSSQTYTRPGFRAFWIGADAHVPVEVRRSDPSSKSASTLLYLHGGGFSLGSVAFYAEALIRIVTKVCAMEDRDNDARCVAVEYDLGPTSRFPGPLLQCLRCYAHLVEVEGIDPACITIAGDSAGGNLTMAMLLCLDGQARGDARLAERDWSALPMPGKAILISPWADLRPSSSLAFAPLRQAAAAAPPPATASSKKPSSRADGNHYARSDHPRESSNVRVSAWTEAIGQHEWDYVAAEALMHFAQLYAGVLKTPRRVRGPMGWVANMCAVLAGDDQDAGSPRVVKKATHSATAPLAILRTLLSPPQRVARAAHSILTEPLLNRANTAAATFSPRARSATDAFNQVHHVRSTAAGALDPIFPAEERQTDAVASTADLYIPIWNDQLDDVQREKAKRGSGDPDFEQAKALLETSKLINPAIGDWSRIKLKHGMLVLWGDRERLADDIEVWIERVRQSQSTRSQLHVPEDDKPGQDSDSSPRFSATPNSQMHTSGQTLQERRAASRSPHRLPPEEDERVVDWLCTAVEHGPGGVHAWPFVSMYLAGSEAEREKGLEIIARFIAEPALSPESSLPPTPTSPVASLAVQLPDTHHHRYLSTAANSPPHLNAVSPAGSMPSDISRGDEDENDYPFPGSSYTDSEGWDPSEQNELGLEGIYPHETVWTQPTPTPSAGMGTPLDSDVEHESLGHDELVHRVGLGLGGHDAAQRTEQAPTMMEPVHLHRPVQAVGSTWNPPSRSEGRATSTQSHGRVSSAATARHASAQSLGGSVGGRSLAELEAESDMSAPPSRPDSPGSAGREDEGSYDSRDDDDDDDLDAPSPQELDRDAFFGGPVAYADDAIPMDPGFYGLAHYHTLRPEGLSDIAEEESQFDTSSVLSSGGNGGSGALSPGSSGATFSPEDGRSPNVGATRAASSNAARYAAGYTPSAAEMARLREALDERERQYQQRFARSAGRFPIEDEDESLGNDGGSDGDVDWLDMDHGRQQQQQQQQQSPWKSSAELPSIGSINRPSVTAGADARTSVSKPVGGSEPRSSPQPRRSNDLQDSGAPDVWW
ncbi:putative esterase/lipase [Pseudozyma hubeiensis]|nr:putative esterase/lipase [Pseudozyma hubeiensis]